MFSVLSEKQCSITLFQLWLKQQINWEGVEASTGMLEKNKQKIMTLITNTMVPYEKLFLCTVQRKLAYLKLLQGRK